MDLAGWTIRGYHILEFCLDANLSIPYIHLDAIPPSICMIEIKQLHEHCGSEPRPTMVEGAVHHH
jgi:hypothetical protein